VALPVALLAFALEYSGRSPTRPGLTYALLLIPGLALVIAAFAAPVGGLIHQHARLLMDGGQPALLYDFTPALWAVALYSLALAGWALGRLALKFMQGPALVRGQIGLVLAGNLIPAVGSLLTLTELRGLPWRDISPFTFAIGNLIVLGALRVRRLFEVVPLARGLVIDSLSDAVTVLDAEGRLVDLNPAAATLIHGTPADVIGRPAAEVFAAWPGILDHFHDSSEGQPGNGHLTTGDGRSFQIRSETIRDAKGLPVGQVLMARDVTQKQAAEDELLRHRNHLAELVRERTAELEAAAERLLQQAEEREKLEEQFYQAQKTEAIGRLAGGVAHDFNNLLMAMMGRVELALISGTLTAEVQTDLEQVLKACHHAAALTQQLLAFSRKQALQLVAVDLNATLLELEPMVRRLVGEDVEVELRLAEDLGQVMADPGRLQQVVMNLVVNARDAMPQGGRLVIDTADLPGRDGPDPRPPDAPSGPCVRFRVSDTGSGMSPETLSRVFEPFFTTKEKGRGTGLGLSTVHGIVHQTGGAVEVWSKPGRGTTFTVYLPRMAGEPSTPLTATSVEDSAPGTETILLVEDDDLVRTFVERVLQARGYHVLAARDADEGSGVAADFTGEIHLLLTDVVMPAGPSGPELAERLLAKRPNMRVLFMSGYTDDVTLRHGARSGGVHMLDKPFSAGVLASRIRELFGEERG
jgi:PAS domain S-box-containing protein